MIGILVNIIIIIVCMCNTGFARSLLPIECYGSFKEYSSAIYINSVQNILDT